MNNWRRVDVIDKDILASMATQDPTTNHQPPTTKKYVNNMIRHFMNFKTT